MGKVLASHAMYAKRTIIPSEGSLNISWRAEEIKKSMDWMNSKKDFQFPEMPDIVLKISNEVHVKFPNINNVIALIESNPILCGEVIGIFLKLGLDTNDQKVITIEYIIYLIGLERTYNIVMSAAFKLIPIKNELFDKMLEHVVNVSLACANIAGFMNNVVTEEAYLFGMFKESGFLILSTLDDLNFRKEWERSLSFPGSYSEYNNSNHEILSVIMSRKWGIGKTTSGVDILIAIQEHHNVEAINQIKNDKVRTLIAIGILAEVLVLENLSKFYKSTEIFTLKEEMIKTLDLSENIVNSVIRKIVNKK
jgi:HD-like signal output (HDOD) protein